VGVLVTWILVTPLAVVLFGVSWPVAALLGAILTVTGPTVVLPILRIVRPRGRAGTLARWEGILNDPVGAVLAVLVFEAVIRQELDLLPVLAGIGATAFIGILIGGAGALALVLLMRFHGIPEFLESPFALMLVVAAYLVSDRIQAESGLLSVTLMGIALANQPFVRVRNIVEFKETLRVLLISLLFIVLSARIDTETLRQVGWRSAVFVAALVLVVRPAAVFLSTMRSTLGRKEKVFLAWMAPRGIVAAAVSSVFAFRLAERGIPGAEILVPEVFAVIVGTVVLYGFTAAPVARWLGVAGGLDHGVLFLGAHGWARDLAAALQGAGFKVLLVDTNPEHVAAAVRAGLPAEQRNILDGLPEDLPLEGIGRLVALTGNDEVNTLAALHFGDHLGRANVYQLPPDIGAGGERVPRLLGGRRLFADKATYAEMGRRVARGDRLQVIPLTEDLDYTSFREGFGDSLVLFVIEDRTLRVTTADERLSARPGQLLLALLPAVAGEGDQSPMRGGTYSRAGSTGAA
jgi:Kef-type K+ transport system membrane component KefB